MKEMNAMVRRFLPKGYSFKTVTQYYLDNIAFEINFMPKKIFGFKSVFEKELEY